MGTLGPAPVPWDRDDELGMSPLPPDFHLESEMRAAIEYSLGQTRLYGFIYYSMRIALIVLSVCASAKGIGFLLSAAPVLSLLVAIGTGIDTWLKPGLRHKIHYTYHDLFRKLLTELRFIDKSDVDALKVIKRHFYEIDDEYRKEVFSV